MKKDLYIFDFDGTLTYRDSLPGFIQFACGRGAYYMGILLLSPVLAGYKLGIIRNDIAKERLLRFFFKDWDAAHFNSIAERYSRDHLDRIIRPKARKYLENIKKEGHAMVVVSASIDQWLRPWCHQNGLETIATQMEVIDGKLSGKFESENCYGPEKARRIQQRYDLSQFERIHVFGDSRGDKEMLALGTHSFYRFFH